jgi:hypothetical protein
VIAKRISHHYLAISLVLAVSLLGRSFPTNAQQPKKIPQIGYLAGAVQATNSTRSEPFRLALRDLGYIEGQNIGSSTDLQRVTSVAPLSLRLS